MRIARALTMLGLAAMSWPSGADPLGADHLGDWTPAPLDPSRWTPTFVVAADGSGTHRTLQAAIDALPGKGKGSAARSYVLVKPGTYREPLCIQDKAPFALYGAGDPGRSSSSRAATTRCPSAVASPRIVACPCSTPTPMARRAAPA